MPKNEPVLEYRPQSAETKKLKEQLASLSRGEIEIPLIINGKEVRTGKTKPCIMPHNHRHVLGKYHEAGPSEIKQAVDGALKAWQTWSRVDRNERAKVFLNAAELLAGKHRMVLNAATMLGQSKTCYQAEIDSACELIDFYRFNAHFADELEKIQPISGPGQKNHLEYRPLEGFVFAVTPFNFTSIAGNLPTSPALMGNVSLWKPASTSVYSGYFIMKLLEEAGLPPGVIQFIPGSGAMVGDIVLNDPMLAGIHFTGSTGVFNQMWDTIGKNIKKYRGYPRVVGETGGKDFVVAHPSADIPSLVTALVRGSFEYQGQKCSAASRAYIPKSLWGRTKEMLVEEIKTIKMGDISDFKNFMGAVIDKNSFSSIKNYIDKAKKEAEVIAGGTCDDSEGFFVAPTVIETTDPKYRTMCEEIFGPVLTVYCYEDKHLDETLQLVDETSPYALTGAILAQDKKAIEHMSKRLTHSAGNFYINNKPTGAVVGQQPFGGGRGSGTNDKAGSIFNLIRWVSARTVSETFTPPTNYKYPFMENQ